MRAVVRDECGGPDVLTIEEIDKPELVDDGVLVRVRAAALNPTDYVLMRDSCVCRPGGGAHGSGKWASTSPASSKLSVRT